MKCILCFPIHGDCMYMCSYAVDTCNADRQHFVFDTNLHSICILGAG